MLAGKLLSSGLTTNYVDDLFSAFTRTGTGASATITTGLDLATKGGLVVTKSRSGATDWSWTDTVRGATNTLVSNSTGASTVYATRLTAFGATGYTLGNSTNDNNSGATYVDFSFVKAPKFFDVVTYTGDGTANRQIAHSLGITPGMIIVKRTNTTSDWAVYHKDLGTFAANSPNVLLLNTTAAIASWSAFVGNPPTSSTFTVNSAGITNTTGDTYVAYLFAHDTSTDGIVQCGSFTTDGSGNATVNLGWEPQFLMVKQTNAAGSWTTWDTSRGWSMSNEPYLYADLSSAESNSSNNRTPTATGFKVAGYSAGDTFIYLAIRRPNKPPTTGTQVYNAIARTGTGAAATVTGVGFAPDWVLSTNRPKTSSSMFPNVDRLRGASATLFHSRIDAESTDAAALTSFNMDGISVGTDGNNLAFNFNTASYINWFFRRAPGVFDIVAYTGTGVARTVAHGLGVVPEMMIIKVRSLAGYAWRVYHAGIGNTKALSLNAVSAEEVDTYWANTSPTSSVFTVSGYGQVNASGAQIVAYLFASKAGISKCGTYTGNGGTQTINCGFSTGARFILIKRTDSTGDWFVWDTVRGIVAGNDPHLSLNTAAAEVTTNDSIDPDVVGFSINQLAATNINVTSATYIYLAFA